MIYTDSRKNEIIIPWTEIESISRNRKVIYLSYNPYIVHTYTINSSKLKKSLSLNDQTFAADEIVQKVELATLDHLYAPALRKYQEGNVSFEAVSLSPQGISYRNKMLPWSQVAHFTVNKQTGAITIRQHGQHSMWANVASGKVNNVVVLRMLIEKNVLPEYGFHFETTPVPNRQAKRG